MIILYDDMRNDLLDLVAMTDWAYENGVEYYTTADRNGIKFEFTEEERIIFKIVFGL